MPFDGPHDYHEDPEPDVPGAAIAVAILVTLVAAASVVAALLAEAALMMAGIGQ